MKESQKFEVKIVSNEMVKPSSSTTSDHPKTFTLSLLDQGSPPLYTPLLLFYPNSNSFMTPTKLKISLAKTLSRFYPLAGRLESEMGAVVLCNDEGIPFIETQVDTDLSAVFNSPQKVELFTDFLPTQYCNTFDPRQISEVVPLAFQVNVFQCGGLVKGCYFHHKLLDIASLGTFLKYWSAVATNRWDNVIQPDFNSAMTTFPPSATVKSLSLATLQRYVTLLTANPSFKNVVAKSYVFSNDAADKLKAMAASERLHKPTKFEAVAGFIWEHALDAACTAGSIVHSEQGTLPTKTGLSFFANIRSRTNPPLPKGSMGNVVREVTARAERGVGYQHLVAEIHEAISTLSTRVSSFLAKNRASDEDWSIEEWREGVENGMYKPGYYRASSWCKLGLDEADFGLGKPKWIVPTDGELYQLYKNLILFTDYFESDLGGEGRGDGIEAWMFLDRKEFDILESNSQFVAFASPN